MDEFETVKSLWERLARKNPTRLINIDPIPQHIDVEFTGIHYSKTIITDSKSTLNPNQLRVINFQLNPTNSTIKLFELVKVLATLNITGHDQVPVMFRLYLIKKKINPESFEIKTLNNITLQNSDLNPYKRHEKFKSKLSKVVRHLAKGSNGDFNLILTWIRKMIPQDYKLFVVEDEFYHGSDPLIRNYLFDPKQISRIFNSDPQCPQLYICNLTKLQMSLLFGKRKQRENIVNKLLDRMLERKQTESDSVQVDQTESNKPQVDQIQNPPIQNESLSRLPLRRSTRFNIKPSDRCGMCGSNVSLKYNFEDGMIVCLPCYNIQLAR